MSCISVKFVCEENDRYDRFHSPVCFYDPNSALRIQQTEKCSAVKLFFRVEERNCLFLGVCVRVFFPRSSSSLEFLCSNFVFLSSQRPDLAVCV